MSIKLMSQVWEKMLTHSEQSVLLAMTDYADDEGRNCYPSYERLAWKTGYSKRQVQRIIQGLCDVEILIIVKPATQHHSPHYWICLNKACDKAPFRVDISDTESRVDISDNDTRDDNLSTLTNDDDTRVDKLTTLENPEWTFETSRVDMVSTDPLVNHQLKEEEKEEVRAGEPLMVAWQQAYADIEMPPKLAESLKKLVVDCGMAATIHGIKASAKKEGGRNFKYIAECARNYVPPAPVASYTNGNSYQVPGIVSMPVAPLPAPIPEPPPPMAHSDPWAICVAELAPAFASTSAGRWMNGSRLEANGELAGVPFYRVVLTERGADALWMTQQAEPAIRKKLASLLGKRVQIEIVAEMAVTA